MHDLTRREALLGLSGLLVAPVVAGCGASTTTVADATRRPDPGPALAAFDNARPAGPPSGLPRRVAWANTADTEIFVALGNGMKRAASDSGLGYVTANANNDPETNINQMDTFLARGIGGMLVQPLDPTSQTPVMAKAISQGVCVQGIINNPCTIQIAASQYDIGYAQGRAAARYARAQLGGKAEVLYFNQDQASPQLRIRHLGVLAGLKTGGPGVSVVANVNASAIQGSIIQGGYELTLAALQQHPGLTIFMGGDTPVVGAYRALQQTGQLRPAMYLSGVDGDANALALIKQGGPYRTSFAFPWPLMGYGMGRFAADWIDGRSVPRIMVAKATVLDSPAAVRTFQAANAEPGPVFTDRARYETYLPLLGNVSYAERHTYWQQDYVPR